MTRSRCAAADAPSAEAVSSFSIRQYWPFAVHAGLSSMARLAVPAEIVAIGVICRRFRSAEKLIRSPRHGTIP